MHGEDAVVGIGRDEVIVRHRQLNANHHRLQSGYEQEEQRVPDVHEPDLFMVDGGDPAVDRLQIRTA